MTALSQFRTGTKAFDARLENSGRSAPAGSLAASATPATRRVSLVALPDAMMSTLSGIYDVINALRMSAKPKEAAQGWPPLQIEIVGATRGSLELTGGVHIDIRRSIHQVRSTDIVVVPSILVGSSGWTTGRHPELVDWLRAMHRRGAWMCSAGSGLFLLAETGIFDGRFAAFPQDCLEEFVRTFPAVHVRPRCDLIVSGGREELISSSAPTNGCDLALYLIARCAGSAAAHAVARRFALQLRHDALAPYSVFEGRRDHGDAEILAAQHWLDKHFSVACPVDEMIKRSRLACSTFKRRFTNATGFCPIAYVQRLRIENAKGALEDSDVPIDEISWQSGYEDPAFFRRLFRRTTGMTPGVYRKRYRTSGFG